MEQEAEFAQLFKAAQGVENEESSKKTLGNDAKVKFVNFNKEATAKVDSGATTSSLHATDVVMSNGAVRFRAPVLSNNEIKMDLVGQQDVHTSDNKEGGEVRPIVKFDIEVDGHPIKDVMFNLNDRSHMDTQILLGQNVLQAGNFVIDVSKDKTEESPEVPGTEKKMEQAILDAIDVLIENNITLADILKIMSTKALREITY